MSDETQTVPESPDPQYDLWTVEQITEWATTATEKLRQAAITYETANQNRPQVLEALGATPEA